MNNIISIVCRIFLLAFIAFASACNTMPSSSSSSTSGSPPPSGSSSSSSSSSNGSSGSSQPGSQSSASGNGAGQQGTSSQTGVQGQGTENSGVQADSNSAYGKGEKSDDEILADALGEFDKKLNETQVEADAQGRQASQQQANDSPGNGQGTMTEEERTGKLDEQLNSKFAKFDDLMLGERETIAKGDNEAGSGRGSYGMEDGQGDGDDPLQTAMASPQAPYPGGGMKGDKRTEDLPPAPSDIGSGQNDDIIARQLREAASKEQDPELRARLWDEYRKYKKGA